MIKKDKKMNITVNPKGVTVNQFLMKTALPLGGYFIIEYLIRNYTASNIFLGLLNLPMMAVTAVLLFLSIRKLRDLLLDGQISGFMAWTFGVQLMFFAGLIEAAFIYLFNEFLVPTNLVTVHNQLVAQYESALTTIEGMASASNMAASMIPMVKEMIELLKDTPVATAIETAISMLSNDIFYGMLIMAFVAPIVRKKK